MKANNKQKAPSFKFQVSSITPYTLIEILMVIVIMALLMVAAMPAFTEMMKGQGVEASARNIGQTLKLARSYAINNRENVAVLIPKENLPSNYNFRGYRVCLVNSDNSFKRWLPGENWEFMSTGVAVVDIDNDPNYDAGAYASATPPITAVNCSGVGASYSSVDLTGLVFKPTGKSSTPAYIVIGEAVESGGSLQRTNTSGDVNIVINEFTGRVTFGEE